MKRSELEETLAFQIAACGLLDPVEQYVLPETGRRHQWDFAWPEQRLLVDVQGAIWVDHKGHNSGAGITKDCIKFNLATVAGYRYLLVTSNQINDGQAIEWIEQALKAVML